MCVNRAVAFGPGDTHVTSTRLVRSFLLGRVPAYADGGLNVVDVRDVATGHPLADEHGTVGALHPGRAQLHLRPTVRRPRPHRRRRDSTQGAAQGRRRGGFGVADRARAHQAVAPGDSRREQFWTYRSTKAKRDLGWKARSHEDTLEATVSWYQERERERIVRARRSQQLQYRVAGSAISVGEGVAGAAGCVLRGLGARGL